MIKKHNSWLAFSVGLGAALFSILGVCELFLTKHYPYRINYQQENTLDEITYTTLGLILAGIFCGVVSLCFNYRKSRWFVKAGFFLCITLSAISFALILPSGVHSVLTAKTICINNARNIESAKAEWAHNIGATNGAEVTWNDIAPFLKNGLPKCPEGGTYQLGRVDEPVLCSIANHRLPQQK